MAVFPPFSLLVYHQTILREFLNFFQNNLKAYCCAFGASETQQFSLIQGCITAEELKFVLTHLPGKVTYKEIDEMIRTVDENGDGKINYQEFRVMIGAKPNLKAAREAQKAAEAVKKTTVTSTTNTTMTFTTTVGTMATNGMHANTMTTAAGGMKWTQRWTLCVSLVEVEQLSTSLSRLSYSPLRQQSVKYLMLSIEKAKEEMKVA